MEVKLTALSGSYYRPTITDDRANDRQTSGSKGSHTSYNYHVLYLFPYTYNWNKENKSIKPLATMLYRESKVSIWSHCLFWFCTETVFIWIVYSWPLAGEVTWPYIWEGVQYKIKTKNNFSKSETNTELSKLRWTVYFQMPRYLHI